MNFTDSARAAIESYNFQSLAKQEANREYPFTDAVVGGSEEDVITGWQGGFVAGATWQASQAVDEIARLRGVCDSWGENYQSWVDAKNAADAERDTLRDAIVRFLDSTVDLAQGDCAWPEELAELVNWSEPK